MDKMEQQETERIRKDKRVIVKKMANIMQLRILYV